MQIEEARELIEKWPLGFKDWPDGTGEMMKEFTSQLLQAQSLISREEERQRNIKILKNTTYTLSLSTFIENVEAKILLT